MAKKVFAFVVFAFLVIFSLFTYIPKSDSVSLTNNPYGRLDSYSVSGNWSTYGELNNLQTDGDIIYPGKLQTGNFTSFVQMQDDSRTLRFEIISDPLDGNITAYINSWIDSPNGDSPDQQFVINVQDENQVEVLNSSQYNYFNVVIKLEETANSADRQPSVDSFNLVWRDESDQLGLTTDDFQILTLFVFIGCSLLAFMRFVE